MCRPLNRAATHRRYAQENPERVRAWSRRYSRSEKCRASARGWGERNIVKLKSYRQAYYEHNRERILARRKEQRAAQWPRPRRCRAILCRRSFLVGPKQGAKAYCDQCISAFYGASRLKTRAA